MCQVARRGHCNLECISTLMSRGPHLAAAPHATLWLADALSQLLALGARLETSVTTVAEENRGGRWCVRLGLRS